MMIHKTKEELLEGLEKKAREKGQKYLAGEWHEPYGDADEKELQGLIFGGNVVRKSRKTKRKQTARKRIPAISDDSSLVEACRWMGDVVRSALGLPNPVPLEELEEELKRIEVPKNEKGTIVWYPRHDWIEGLHEGLHIWEIGSARFPDITPYITRNAFKFRIEDAIEAISLSLHCHPALALAFLMCDIPLGQDIVTVIIGPFGKRMAIYIGGVEVPIWLTSAMYKYARFFQLTLKQEKVVESPRPRATSKRVSTLIDFVQRNEALGWKERWEKWNNDCYTQWKYKSENSMRSVFYRAKPKLRKARGSKK